MTAHPFGQETTEFHREFAQQTDILLRRRLIWFVAIWGGLGLLGIIPGWIALLDTKIGAGILGEQLRDTLYSDDRGLLRAALNATWIGAYAATLALALKGALSRNQALYTSLALITLDGLYGIALRLAGADFGVGVMLFALSHFVASLVFPWTARQAAVPAVIVLAANAAARLLFEVETNPTTGKTNVSVHLLAIGFSPLIAVPGCLVAWGRHSRRLGQYRLTFVQRRYGTLRQELSYARAIHESMFPNPRTTGSVCFTYRYEPMRQIGGDYLFASTNHTSNGDESLSVVLLDVTGHGIPAALTVNRLHGEIELLFADDPHVSPGDVLRKLNRYVHLTLARHSIYVTAMCLRVDPQRGVLEYASGGHPPAFLRAVDGTLNDLNSTTFVLGACHDDDFEPGQASIPFGPGDSLIAYTDGATEARTETGQMLRIDGMRRLLADPARVAPGHWPERLLDAVARHRAGLPPEDDTLVVEIYRSLNPAKPCPTPKAATRQPAF